MSIYDIPLTTLDGASTTLAEHKGKVLLLVNVASRCGLTPQYEGLERLQQRFGDQGFSVLGFPSNQFGGQEPGTSEDIAEFCSATYGVSFPMYEKIDVNGAQQHPLYAELTAIPDAAGVAGEVQWNFEKFLVGADGETLARLRPKVEPESDEVVALIESHLPGQQVNPARP